MSDLEKMAAEANGRRYAVAKERGRNRSVRLAVDMFPEARAPAELTDGDQRYTTRITDVWCRQRAGVDQWDIDVAACEEAHLAENFFTKEIDGLQQWWFGRVWCNPPFSDIEPWVVKAWKEIERDAGPSVIAMLLPANRTEQQWWQTHIEPHRDRRLQLETFFLPSRTRFGHPGNPEGVGVGSPPFGCVLLVWRRA